MCDMRDTEHAYEKCEWCGKPIDENGIHIKDCVICKQRIKRGHVVAPGQVMCDHCWRLRGNE